jgi:hypothetical protein
MNRPIRLSMVMFVLTVFSSVFAADPKPAKEKPPAEIASDAFLKWRDSAKVNPTAEQQSQLIDLGIAYLIAYPMGEKVRDVIFGLAGFAEANMKGKALAPQRAYWLSKLQYEIINKSGGELVNKESPAALKALSAAAAGAQLAEIVSRENSKDYREKIDQLAAMPEGGRYLPDQERAYIQAMKKTGNTSMAEKQATQLLGHADKRIARMAQEEMNLIQIAKQPLELTFPALDGTTVNLAELRGKVIHFAFFATTNEASTKELLALKTVSSGFRKEQLAILAVSLDVAADRGAVEVFVKKNKISWPIWYAGAGPDNDLGARLNISWVPQAALFDTKGMFVSTGVRSDRLTGQINRLLGIK